MWLRCCGDCGKPGIGHVFENKWPLEPVEVIHRICFWIDSWANLQRSEDVKLELQLGAKLLGQVAEDTFRGGRGAGRRGDQDWKMTKQNAVSRKKGKKGGGKREKQR